MIRKILLIQYLLIDSCISSLEIGIKYLLICVYKRNFIFNFMHNYYLTYKMIKVEKYLPHQYKVQLKLASFWIGSIKKQEASRAIELLKINQANFTDFSHLKRIRKKNNQDELIDILLCNADQEQQFQRISSSLGQMLIKIYKQDLPISNPSTKQQFAEWSVIWPINFIQQDIYREIKHNNKQLQFIEKICKEGQKQIVIFSDKNQILLIKAIDKQCQQGTIQHFIMKILQQWPNTKQFNQLPNAYYLTKLRLFLPIKICQMCSMALVHSRLQRIYFPKNQDIEKISQILCCSKLNHRIKIFQISKNPQNI